MNITIYDVNNLYPYQASTEVVLGMFDLYNLHGWLQRKLTTTFGDYQTHVLLIIAAACVSGGAMFIGTGIVLVASG